MFEHIDLENYYSVQTPVGNDTIEMKMKLPGQENAKIKNYYINKDIKNGPIEYFTVYDSGIVLFMRQTNKLIEFYTNREFNLMDDGFFYLVD